MRDWAELLKAIAALAWPLVVLFAIFTFKGEIKLLASRLRRGKFFGQEIELNKSLDQLHESTEAAASEIESIPQIAEPIQPNGTDDEELIRQILSIAAHSPKAALLQLASEIEKETRQLMASMGLLKGRRNLAIHDAFSELDESRRVPSHVLGSLRLFWGIRNRLVHGQPASDDDVLRAVDSGMTILRALQAIPHEVNIVYHPGVELYFDAECKNPIDGVKGVILETLSPGGVSKSRRIFPTTQTHFSKGTRVAWEWSNKRQFDRAWYRDPDSGESMPAWHSSMEFVGRPLNEI